jgi:dihydrodipicolinate synthase/N-acetylneuraminate lyase
MLGAINVAAITPHRDVGFDSDLGATLELIDFLCGAGVDGIALLGSTGEFPHLTLEDRSHLTRLAVKRSRVPIVAGVTHSTFDGTVALAQQAAQAGVAAVLAMPPYFFPYPQSEVREFYLRFAERMGGAVPIYLYNIPLFTSELAVETACELLASGGFAGIKDSSGSLDNFARFQALRESAPFQFLVGDDAIFMRALSGGADGGVSGVACAIPELMLGLNAAIVRRDTEKAQRLDGLLQEFIGWLGRFPTPVAIKEAVAARGLKVGPPTLPLSPEKRCELDHFISWFKNWLPSVQKECGGT